jgi:hypothetical protein
MIDIVETVAKVCVIDGVCVVEVAETLEVVVGKLEVVVGKLEVVVGKLEVVVGKLEVVVGKLEVFASKLEVVVSKVDAVMGRFEVVVRMIEVVGSGVGMTTELHCIEFDGQGEAPNATVHNLLLRPGPFCQLAVICAGKVRKGLLHKK